MVLDAHSLKDIKKEISKCEIVCANCHRVRTFNRRTNRSENMEWFFCQKELPQPIYWSAKKCLKQGGGRSQSIEIGDNFFLQTDWIDTICTSDAKIIEIMGNNSYSPKMGVQKIFGIEVLLFSSEKHSFQGEAMLLFTLSNAEEYFRNPDLARTLVNDLIYKSNSFKKGCEI